MKSKEAVYKGRNRISLARYAKIDKCRRTVLKKTEKQMMALLHITQSSWSKWKEGSRLPQEIFLDMLYWYCCANDLCTMWYHEED